MQALYITLGILERNFGNFLWRETNHKKSNDIYIPVSDILQMQNADSKIIDFVFREE